MGALKITLVRKRLGVCDNNSIFVNAASHKVHGSLG